MNARRETDEAERARANREASGWAILLQENAEDRTVQAEFSAWLEGAAVRREAWSETQRITQAIRIAPAAHADRWRGKMGSIVPFARRRPGRRVAVFAMAAAACLAVVAAPGIFVTLRADLSTGTGETRRVQLADGSTLRLAPESAVVLDVARGGERDVRILAGRAWFEVAPDRIHPFRVTAADTTTTVLGTGFEVRRIGGRQVEVQVQHGRVRVDCHDQPGIAVQLTAGDALDLRCVSDKAVRGRMDPSLMGAWADGQILASDRPVGEVIEALRPWYRGTIVTFGKGFDQRRVTGVYDARQPERVLHALARSHHLRIRNLTPWITVISPK